jgi:hypothetical protein
VKQNGTEVVYDFRSLLRQSLVRMRTFDAILGKRYLPPSYSSSTLHVIGSYQVVDYLALNEILYSSRSYQQRPS